MTPKDFRVATYVAKPGLGVGLFAANAATLLAAAPEFARLIDEEIGALDRGRPCWVLVLDDEPEAAVGVDPVPGAPAWWVALRCLPVGG